MDNIVKICINFAGANKKNDLVETEMLPVISIGALLGIRMVKLFPEKAFRRFIQIVTILSVVMMLV